MKKIGIYVHIPFCKKKCDYCDFISFNKNEDIQKKYIECLIKSIQATKKYIKLDDVFVQTIYIGGGTPSYISSKYIEMILANLNKIFNISKDAEITIEVNPGTVTKEKIETYKKSGINRISIGLQSTENDLLKMLGRIHTYEQFLDSYEIVRKAGINNVNVDLMLGLPNQTLSQLEDSVNEIIKLNPEHISVYSLILEEGTNLEKKILDGILKMPEEDLERKMYHKIKKIFEKNDYIHYEISNFSKQNYNSKHNTDCWNQKEYLGYGLASHSYFDNKRFSNISNLDLYLKNINESKFEKNIEINEIQTIEEKRKEYMLLGLRKLEGISISEFEQKFGINPLFYFRFEISKLENENFIEVDLDRIKLTKKGLDFANFVWEEFV